MKIAAPASGEVDLRMKKKVEASRKAALGLPCPFGNGFQLSMRLCKPGDDQAGICKPDAAQQNCMCVNVQESGGGYVIQGLDDENAELSTAGTENVFAASVPLG